jgi:hypothetical protein
LAACPPVARRRCSLPSRQMGTVKGQGAASGVFSGGPQRCGFWCWYQPDFAGHAGLPAAVTWRHRVTAADQNVVLALDHEPALEVMLRELKVSLQQPREVLQAVRATLVGLTSASGLHAGQELPTVTRTGNFGSDVMVRHIIGLDPGRAGVVPWRPRSMKAWNWLFANATCRQHAPI